MSSPCLLHMKFPRCVVERISMKYDRNLGAFGTKERNEIWAEVGRNSGLRQPSAGRRAKRTSPSALRGGPVLLMLNGGSSLYVRTYLYLLYLLTLLT